MLKRPTRLIIVIGTNGTGKTTILDQFIKVESNRSLIVAPDDKDWLHIPLIYDITKETFQYTGIKRRIWENNLDLDYIVNNFENGLLVFDDCRSYFKSGNIDTALHRLMIRRRQAQIDIMVAAHGFSEIPPKFYTFATDIILFKTCDNIASRKNYIREYDKMLYAQTSVNILAETNPHAKILIKL